MSTEFRKDIPLSVPGRAVKMLWPCVFPVVIVLRLSDFSVFGLRRLNVVPCIHHWKDVWCRMFCSHDAGGGSGACGIFHRCRLRFGKRDLASSFFPCEFFNAPVALGLSSVDFWPVTSPLRRPNVVACLIHWMIIGRRLYRGKRRWVSYQRMCFRVGVGCFFGFGLGPCVYPVVTVLRLSDFSVFGLRRLNVVPCIHHWKVVWCRTLFARRGWGGVVGVCSLVRWECFVEPGAQVDVDRVSRRHSTLHSWACGENVCGLAFFQW
jgi:hypothetical protein